MGIFTDDTETGFSSLMWKLYKEWLLEARIRSIAGNTILFSKVVFPEPLTPVIQTSFCNGMSISRLCILLPVAPFIFKNLLGLEIGG